MTNPQTGNFTRQRQQAESNQLAPSSPVASMRALTSSIHQAHGKLCSHRVFNLIAAMLLVGFCACENDEQPLAAQQDAELDSTVPDVEADMHEEPYREPVYELLAEDDPNQTCCYVQVMRLERLSQPGGRRPCNVDPESGPSIPCSYPNDWRLRIVDGCPVFVLEPGGAECSEP